MAQVKVTSILSIEHQQYGVALYCKKKSEKKWWKKEEGGKLYIMMSLFVWEKICTIVSNVHLSWYFLFFLLFNISQMLELLIINLMMCEKNSILYSRVESHTAVINNEMSIVLQNLKNSVTLLKETVLDFLIWQGKSTLKLNSGMQTHTGILAEVKLTELLKTTF